MTDENEDTVSGNDVFFTCLYIFNQQFIHAFMPPDFFDHRIQKKTDLWVGSGAIFQDRSSSEGVTPVNNSHTVSKTGQKYSFLERAVPTANNVNILVPVEPAITSAAVRDTSPDEFFLTGDIEPLVVCSHGDDQRVRCIVSTRDTYSIRMFGKVNRLNFIEQKFRAEGFCLFLKKLAKLHSSDPIWESRIVFDCVGQRRLSIKDHPGYHQWF